MENGVEDSYEAETRERSRSLDLKTVYESSISKEYETNCLKRNIPSESIENVNRSASKKSKKALQLSGSRGSDRKKRKSLKAVYSRSLTSVSIDSQGSGTSGLGQKLKKSPTLKDGSPLCLKDSVNKIPGGKRRFVGRNNFEADKGLSREKKLCCEDSFLNPPGQQSVEDPESQVDFLKVKQKKVSIDLNGDKRCETSLTKILNKEDGFDGGSGANDRSSLLRGFLKNDGIRNGQRRGEKHCKRVGKSCQPLVDGSVNSSLVKSTIPDNDEENLEENAARMLSSRFSPSWTGFSSNIRAASRPMNRSLSANNHEESIAISGSDTAFVDDAGRPLRLTENEKVKTKQRERRHYYEISSNGWDAYWVLNRKIKVFWPLDESWYLGLVNDYDENCKLHHVKYEDHDEEWIDLQHEKFKLLLLRSEVPSSPEKQRSQLREKHFDEAVKNLKVRKEKGKNDVTGKIDTSNGTYLDSLPIVSWLARSSLQLKRKKTFAASVASSRSPLRDKSVYSTRCLDNISVQKAKQRLYSSRSLSDRTTESGSTMSFSGLLDGLKEIKSPIVYCRRRFHRSRKVFSNQTEGNFVADTVPVLGVVDSTISVVDDFHDFDDREIFHVRSDPENDLWLSDDVGNIILNGSLLHLSRLRFQLSFPPLHVPNNKFAAEDFWLVRSNILRHCGMLMAMWPRVHLEILFVDSIVGFRFLWFEGCLKQAISFIVQVLLIFCGSNKQGKYAELQLPVTSIRFKVSSIKGSRKQIVSGFCSFQNSEKAIWTILASKLGRHCLFTKQLRGFGCTTDSMKAVQHATNQLLRNPSCGELLSVEGSKTKRFIQGGCATSFSRESSASDVTEVSSDRRICVDNSIQQPETKNDLVVNVCPVLSLSKDFENSSEKNLLSPSKGAKCVGCLNFSNFELKSIHSGYINTGHSSMVSSCPEKARLTTVGPRPEHNLQPTQCASLTTSSTGKDRTVKMSTATDGASRCKHLPELTQNMNVGIISNHNLTAPRSTWRRKKSISLSAGIFSNDWSAGRANSYNKFGTGPKKRRTQVSYSLPFTDLDTSSRNKGHNHKGIHYKRIQRACGNRLSETSYGSRRDPDLLSCDVNLLITLHDRGWRECGAQVVLEPFDHNEWKLAVKTSGSMKYSCKANQVLVPGTTNRYTHALMWKGGKDWTLEFPVRTQWAVFKEMYEECYNRNFRAASVKNIPIPGVYLNNDNIENGTKAIVWCSSSKYIKQVKNDVEMALDPSRVLYDMDTDDECWILRLCNSSKTENSDQLEISEEMFEKTMDMFEKTAYTRGYDQFGFDELEELFTGVGLIEVFKSIYSHWRQKRQRKGMPLIRHLQPPLWEKYQRQLKEWELALSKANSTIMQTHGWPEKVPSIEKPPLFAFCLKPRGLELPNKVSKQRSQKRISLSAKAKASMGDHNGRRTEWYAYGDELSLHAENTSESFDESLSSQGSPVPFSPRHWKRPSSVDSNGFDRNYYYQKLRRRELNKFGMYSPSNSPWTMASPFYRRTGKRTDRHHWNIGFSDYQWHDEYSDGFQADFLGPCDSYDFEELQNCSDLDELQLHYASSAARSAHKMAKLKREKAQKLLYRADLAIQKAAVALMTAGATRASLKHDMSDVNDDDR